MKGLVFLRYKSAKLMYYMKSLHFILTKVNQVI